MAVFYMKHFIHGTKVACSEMEVEYDKSHGWVQYDPLVTTNSIAAFSSVIEDEPINAMTKRAYTRKPKD